MDENYLIPANTKRGQLLLGLFKPIDLIILGIGLTITLILIAVLPIDQTLFAVIAVAPGIFAGFLVLPVAYYHNIRQLVTEMIKFIINRKKFVWKGWCFLDESKFADVESKRK